MFKNHIFFLILITILSCVNHEKVSSNNPLETILASNNHNIKRVMDSLSQFAVQIKFTQIERKDKQVYFTDFNFQVDSTKYFYPASSVKFPIAMLALSKLNTIKDVDRNTRFYIEGDTVETTFAKEIEKIFTVSNNQSFNRLFELLGQDYINKELKRISIGPSRISHRLSTDDAYEITTRPLIIYQNDSTVTTLAPSINTSATSLALKDLQKGVGYFEEDSLMTGSFDFSLKNYYPIETQHQFLKTVIFPKMYSENEKINLNEDQLAFIQTTMSVVPRKAGYDAKTYYDGYGKYFMYGDSEENIPDHIKIYNKIGGAYGTLTDCAYIQDTKNNIEFLLTATILVNKNSIYNDDNYEYNEIGIPFLAELGRALYQYELKRVK